MNPSVSAARDVPAGIVSRSCERDMSHSPRARFRQIEPAPPDRLANRKSGGRPLRQYCSLNPSESAHAMRRLPHRGAASHLGRPNSAGARGNLIPANPITPFPRNNKYFPPVVTTTYAPLTLTPASLRSKIVLACRQTEAVHARGPKGRPLINTKSTAAPLSPALQTNLIPFPDTPQAAICHRPQRQNLRARSPLSSALQFQTNLIPFSDTAHTHARNVN